VKSSLTMKPKSEKAPWASTVLCYCMWLCRNKTHIRHKDCWLSAVKLLHTVCNM